MTGDYPGPGHPGARSRLRVQTGAEEHQATTRLVIDGVDLLDLQQPAVHPDGSPRRGGPKQFLPPDPVGLLPPESPALLPTTAGTAAMVGVCTCGDPECSSLWLRVVRDGDTAVWGPDPDSPGDTVDRTWRFDLLPYLDVVDTAAAAALAGEDLPRRLARELRRRRNGLHGFGSTRSGCHLFDARAWPGIPEVRLTVATDAGVVWQAVAVVDGESLNGFCLRVAHLDPHHPRRCPRARRSRDRAHPEHAPYREGARRGAPGLGLRVAPPLPHPPPHRGQPLGVESSVARSTGRGPGRTCCPDPCSAPRAADTVGAVRCTADLVDRLPGRGPTPRQHLGLRNRGPAGVRDGSAPAGGRARPPRGPAAHPPATRSTGWWWAAGRLRAGAVRARPAGTPPAAVPSWEPQRRWMGQQQPPHVRGSPCRRGHGESSRRPAGSPTPLSGDKPTGRVDALHRCGQSSGQVQQRAGPRVPRGVDPPPRARRRVSPPAGPEDVTSTTCCCPSRLVDPSHCGTVPTRAALAPPSPRDPGGTVPQRPPFTVDGAPIHPGSR